MWQIWSHYKSDCPDGKETEGDVCQIIPATTTLMSQVKNMENKESINPMWILCDNESTVVIIKNKSMVTNIRHTNNPI
jgi:hypothetical protein